MDLKGFNEQQKEAILDFEHNLMILACAGSGKTRTITGKIAYAVGEGLIDAYNVCAVTFTNKAAAEMLDRLEIMVPGICSKATVKTFHALGLYLLRVFGERIGLHQDFSIANDDDVASYVMDALKLSGKNGKAEAVRLAKCILDAKEHGLEPEDDEAAAYFNMKNFDLDGPASKFTGQEIFQAYEDKKRDENAIDFPDMIRLAVKLLEEDEYARAYCHDKYHMILVDEYQDSNIMQSRFLKEFAAPNAQLIVVGDDDQSIYAFRGACIDNILDFPNQFPNVRQIKLEKNYRSSEEILRMAGHLIKFNGKRYDKEIASATDKHGALPEFITSYSGYEEAEFIAKTIERRKDLGSIAVLYRQHRMAIALKSALIAHDIPYEVAGGIGVLNSRNVKTAVALLRLCLCHSDHAALHRIISESRVGLGEKAYGMLLEEDPDVVIAAGKIAARETRYSKGMYALVNAIGSLEERLLGHEVRVYEETEDAGREKKKDDDYTPDLFESLDSQQERDTSLPPVGMSGSFADEGDEELSDGKILQKSLLFLGINTASTGESADGSGENNPFSVYSSMLNNRRQFFDWDLVGVQDDGLEPTAEQVLRAFICRSELDDEVEKDSAGVQVTLSTMHAAKGLEWDTVFCIGLEEDVIPGKQVEPEEMEEERRIFYVAITRARQYLFLCHRCIESHDHKNERYTVTPFITENIPAEMYRDMKKENGERKRLERFNFRIPHENDGLDHELESVKPDMTVPKGIGKLRPVMKERKPIPEDEPEMNRTDGKMDVSDTGTKKAETGSKTELEVGNRIEIPKIIKGTVSGEEQFMGHKVLIVKTEAGGIVKIMASVANRSNILQG